MKNASFYLISLILALVFSVIGAFLKILHLPGGSEVLIVSMAFTLAFIVIGLMDVFRTRIRPIEKLMWLTGFLFVSWITGIVYYFVSKRSITTR